MKMVRVALAAGVAAGLAFPVAPAFAQETSKLGPETTHYVFCVWSNVYGQSIFVTQIEEIRWRDLLKADQNGNWGKWEHIGTYQGALEYQLGKKLGLSDDALCNFSPTPTYGNQAPGSTYEGLNGPISVSLHEVDPSWFAVGSLRDYLTIVSLGGKKRPGAAPNPKQASTSEPKAEAEPAPAGPTAAEIAAEKHRAVEERNAAAQAQYEADLAEQQRKVDEFNRLMKEMERKKAEQQAEAQRALDSFKAEQAAHAQQMQQHQQQVSDYQNQLAQQGSKGPATGGRRQATGAIVDSREAAMAALMRLPVGPLSDVQCGEVKMYSPPKWTCWGFYQSDTKPKGASAQ